MTGPTHRRLSPSTPRTAVGYVRPCTLNTIGCAFSQSYATSGCGCADACAHWVCERAGTHTSFQVAGHSMGGQSKSCPVLPVLHLSPPYLVLPSPAEPCLVLPSALSIPPSRLTCFTKQGREAGRQAGGQGKRVVCTEVNQIPSCNECVLH